MTSSPIIKVKKLSKKYNITHQQGGYVAMRDVLTDIAKHPFKFLKSKAKKAIGRETKEEFWALKNINFEIQKGEAVGIIGANGAGKSTLLKLLSKITPPTTGSIEYEGTMSSLLEVGTGFHPELTGRENIFLNGAILGMTKKEIVTKFDDIVKFAEIEKFLDTPVKRYSSGMYVRLAFAVAAHMEPDILVVDEVLAVGDAEFQKKCLGKMGEVTKEAGRTILFVSHNMSAIQNLCKRCILLEGGEVKMIGETKEVINEYLNKSKKQQKFNNIKKNNFFDIENIKIYSNNDIIKSGDNLKIDLILNFKIKLKNPGIVISIKTFNDMEISRFSTLPISGFKINELKGKHRICLNIKNIPLTGGTYNLSIGLTKPNICPILTIADIATFTVYPNDYYKTGYYATNKIGPILMNHSWINEKI